MKRAVMMKNDTYHKRGQAALEFLTTYGWALLVVMVMIGALAYFGVVNPSNLVPEKCVFSSGIGCRDFAGIATSGEVRAKLLNGFGYTIQIDTNDVQAVQVDSSGTSGTVEQCAAGDVGEGNNWCGLAPDDDEGWRMGTEKELVVKYDALTSSDHPQILITIKYKKAGSTYQKEISGQLFVRPG